MLGLGCTREYLSALVHAIVFTLNNECIGWGSSNRKDQSLWPYRGLGAGEEQKGFESYGNVAEWSKALELGLFIYHPVRKGASSNLAVVTTVEFTHLWFLCMLRALRQKICSFLILQICMTIDVNTS